MTRPARAAALAELRGLLDAETIDALAYVAPLEAALAATPKIPGKFALRNCLTDAIALCKANAEGAIDGRYGARHAVEELARRSS